MNPSPILGRDNREDGSDISFFAEKKEEYNSLGVEIDELKRELEIEGGE